MADKEHPGPAAADGGAQPADVAVQVATAPQNGAPAESPPRRRFGCSPSIVPFAVVSTCYLLYTLTDGAIRMIVLLHAYQVRRRAARASAQGALSPPRRASRPPHRRRAKPAAGLLRLGDGADVLPLRARWGGHEPRRRVHGRQVGPPQDAPVRPHHPARRDRRGGPRPPSLLSLLPPTVGPLGPPCSAEQAPASSRVTPQHRLAQGCCTGSTTTGRRAAPRRRRSCT